MSPGPLHLSPSLFLDLSSLHLLRSSPLVSQAAAPLCSYLTAVLHRFALPSADFYLDCPPFPLPFSSPFLEFLRTPDTQQHQTALMFSSMDRPSPPSLSPRLSQLWKTCARTRHACINIGLRVCCLMDTHVNAHRLPPLLSLLSLWKKQILKEAMNKKTRKKWGSPIIPKSLSLVLTPTQEKRRRVNKRYVCLSV